MSTGFGTDVSCGPKGLVTGRLVSGNRLLAESLWRMFNTPQGTLQGGEEESAWGFDLSEYVGSVESFVAINSLPGIMRAKAMTDLRVADIEVNASTLTDPNGSSAIIVDMRVTPASEDEDFSLTLAVTEVDVRVIGGLPQ